ncbi:MAG: hypothetical protein NTX53_04595 [candidate division WOR-3 bacterium]|nr:hypothetical protein [candidate division WOR-3 bacterium]
MFERFITALNTVGINENAAYWICGAGAQAYAALAAVTGVFGVFKLQMVREASDLTSKDFARLLDETQKEGSERFRETVQAHLPTAINEVDLREGMERDGFDKGFKPWLVALRREGDSPDVRNWATLTLMKAHMLLTMLKVTRREYDRCLRAALTAVIMNGVAVIASMLALPVLEHLSGAGRCSLLWLLLLYGTACVVVTVVSTYVIMKRPGAAAGQVVSVQDPFKYFE